MTDHEVTLQDGSHLKRPGRYRRFFQYMSLFCFSMLGLVLAGNVAMVFVFWELVGICSYFLIGFYIERKSASNAANKAFIVNRIGDFGMIIGLMALWASLGTFAFGDIDVNGNGPSSSRNRGSSRRSGRRSDHHVWYARRHGARVGRRTKWRDGCVRIQRRPSEVPTAVGRSRATWRRVGNRKACAGRGTATGC